MKNTHANKRIAQRGITQEQIDACVEYGIEHYSKKALFYVLGKREIKKNKLNNKWNGTIVVIENGVIMTTYINKNFKLYDKYDGNAGKKNFKRIDKQLRKKNHDLLFNGSN